ncbi:MAG: hypothetical protein AB7T49_13880 [Oligoflexales bacterium]
MNGMERTQQLLNEVETLLSNFYGFDILSPAKDHLIQADELEEASGQTNTLLTPDANRASVLISNPSEHELYIGIFLANEILEELRQSCPITRLSESNLDSFCVLIEELSHFHLILNRAVLKQQVSQIELEWQAEIDKVLVCSSLIAYQQGRSNLPLVQQKLFSEAKYLSEQSHYPEANHLAAALWKKLSLHINEQDNPIESQNIRKVLRALYRMPWQEKFASSTLGRFRAA